VRQELIDQNPALVQDLVNYVQGAGRWLDAQREHRARASEIAAGSKYFNQDRAIIQYVMDNPTDRVTYGDLRMIREEFDEVMQLSLEAKTLTRPIAFERYIDERFVKAAVPARIAL
jgi:NitT/TauT family transport system substrate-binding protein